MRRRIFTRIKLINGRRKYPDIGLIVARNKTQRFTHTKESEFVVYTRGIRSGSVIFSRAVFRFQTRERRLDLANGNIGFRELSGSEIGKVAHLNLDSFEAGNGGGERRSEESSHFKV